VNISGTSFDPAIAGVGTHKLIYNVSDPSGCAGADTVNMVVTVCTGLEETGSGASLSINPNPAGDFMNLVITGRKGQDMKIQILNIYGQHVMNAFSGMPDSERMIFPVNISGLPGGIYIVRASDDLNMQSILVKK
jgi:hypothetical protein